MLSAVLHKRGREAILMEDLIERPFLWRRVKERNFHSFEASKLKLMSSLSNVAYANCIGCDVSPNHGIKHKIAQNVNSLLALSNKHMTGLSTMCCDFKASEHHNPPDNPSVASVMATMHIY